LSAAWHAGTNLCAGPETKDNAMRNMIILGAAVAALALSACNTVSGAGRDVSSVGKATTGAAEKAKK
jgi:predicted small secreted protein